eukprot:2331438-Pleurochrysis_carterae.AAC.2
MSCVRASSFCVHKGRRTTLSPTHSLAFQKTASFGREATQTLPWRTARFAADWVGTYCGQTSSKISASVSSARCSHTTTAQQHADVTAAKLSCECCCFMCGGGGGANSGGANGVGVGVSSRADGGCVDVGADGARRGVGVPLGVPARAAAAREVAATPATCEGGPYPLGRGTCSSGDGGTGDLRTSTSETGQPPTTTGMLFSTCRPLQRRAMRAHAGLGTRSTARPFWRSTRRICASESESSVELALCRLPHGRSLTTTSIVSSRNGKHRTSQRTSSHGIRRSVRVGEPDCGSLRSAADFGERDVASTSLLSAWRPPFFSIASLLPSWISNVLSLAYSCTLIRTPLPNCDAFTPLSNSLGTSESPSTCLVQCVGVARSSQSASATPTSAATSVPSSAAAAAAATAAGALAASAIVAATAAVSSSSAAFVAAAATTPKHVRLFFAAFRIADRLMSPPSATPTPKRVCASIGMAPPPAIGSSSTSVERTCAASSKP